MTERCAVLVSVDHALECSGAGFGSATVDLLGAHLRHLGYSFVVCLTDTTAKPELVPTRAAVLEAVERCASCCREEDLLVVYFTGFAKPAAGSGGGAGDGLESTALLVMPPAEGRSRAGAQDSVVLLSELLAAATGSETLRRVVFILDVFSSSEVPGTQEITAWRPPQGVAVVTTSQWQGIEASRSGSMFFNALILCLEEIRTASGGKVVVQELAEMMACDLAQRETDILPILLTDGKSAGTAVLADSRAMVEYTYVLICSISVDHTFDLGYIEEQLMGLTQTTGATRADGFQVSVDLILSLIPLEEVQPQGGLARALEAFGAYCSSRGAEAPQLKALKVETDTGVANPGAVITIEEMVVCYFSVDPARFEELLQEVLRHEDTPWLALFSGFHLEDIRSTFQARCLGSLGSFARAQAHMLAEAPMYDLLVERMWMSDSGDILPGSECGDPDRPRPLHKRASTIYRDHTKSAKGTFCSLPSMKLQKSPSTFMLIDGTVFRSLARHRYWVSGVCFNSDDTLLASCSWDRTVIVWNISTGEPHHVLKGHQQIVSCVAFASQRVSPEAYSANWEQSRLFSSDHGILPSARTHARSLPLPSPTSPAGDSSGAGGVVVPQLRLGGS
eukprot:RCo011427